MDWYNSSTFSAANAATCPCALCKVLGRRFPILFWSASKGDVICQPFLYNNFVIIRWKDNGLNVYKTLDNLFINRESAFFVKYYITHHKRV